MTVAAVEVGIGVGAGVGAGGPHRGLMHFYFFFVVSSSAVITKIVYNEVLWSPLN